MNFSKRIKIAPYNINVVDITIKFSSLLSIVLLRIAPSIPAGIEATSILPHNSQVSFLSL